MAVFTMAMATGLPRPTAAQSGATASVEELRARLSESLETTLPADCRLNGAALSVAVQFSGPAAGSFAEPEEAAARRGMEGALRRLGLRPAGDEEAAAQHLVLNVSPSPPRDRDGLIAVEAAVWVEAPPSRNRTRPLVLSAAWPTEEFPETGAGTTVIELLATAQADAFTLRLRALLLELCDAPAAEAPASIPQALVLHLSDEPYAHLGAEHPLPQDLLRHLQGKGLSPAVSVDNEAVRIKAEHLPNAEELLGWYRGATGGGELTTEARNGVLVLKPQRD